MRNVADWSILSPIIHESTGMMVLQTIKKIFFFNFLTSFCRSQMHTKLPNSD